MEPTEIIKGGHRSFATLYPKGLLCITIPELCPTIPSDCAETLGERIDCKNNP